MVHIPEETSDQSTASEGAAVEMRKGPYDLADLLSRITDDNLHPEQSSGEPQGNEHW